MTKIRQRNAPDSYVRIRERTGVASENTILDVVGKM